VACSELSDVGEFVLDLGAPAPVRGEYERERNARTAGGSGNLKDLGLGIRF
jgi:hypothetical protein